MVKYLKKCILLLFLVPYIYFALLLDYRYHSMFGLIFLIFLAFYTGFLMQKKDQLFLFDSREHRYDCDFLFSMSPLYRLALFYQPFSPTKLILLLAVIYLIPQVMGIFWARIFTEKKQNINIFK